MVKTDIRFIRYDKTNNRFLWYWTHAWSQNSKTPTRACCTFCQSISSFRYAKSFLFSQWNSNWDAFFLIPLLPLVKGHILTRKIRPPFNWLSVKPFRQGSPLKGSTPVSLIEFSVNLDVFQFGMVVFMGFTGITECLNCWYLSSMLWRPFGANTPSDILRENHSKLIKW